MAIAEQKRGFVDLNDTAYAFGSLGATPQLFAQRRGLELTHFFNQPQPFIQLSNGVRVVYDEVERQFRLFATSPAEDALQPPPVASWQRGERVDLAKLLDQAYHISRHKTHKTFRPPRTRRAP